MNDCQFDTSAKSRRSESSGKCVRVYIWTSQREAARTGLFRAFPISRACVQTRAREGGKQTPACLAGWGQLHNDRSADAPAKLSVRLRNSERATPARARARGDEKSRIHRAAGIGSVYFRPSRNREEERPIRARERTLHQASDELTDTNKSRECGAKQRAARRNLLSGILETPTPKIDATHSIYTYSI